MSDQAQQQHEIHITVRSPQGANDNLKVNTSLKASEVVRRAVDDFVKQQLLAAGEYSLALVRNGQATLLPDDDKLNQHGVVDGDVFSLVPKKPQVDG